MTEPKQLETPLPDLTGVSLADLRRLDLAVEQAELVAQVQRPRVNLGGSSPPGRAD
jgi:hypothetical protein